jgi:hypothetical protein
VDGERLPAAETYWNNLLRELLRKAKKVLSTKEISKILICNHVVGKREENGYVFLENVGISVQAGDGGTSSHFLGVTCP